MESNDDSTSYVLAAFVGSLLFGGIGAAGGWWWNRNNNFDGGFYAAVIFGGAGVLVGALLGLIAAVASRSSTRP